MAAITVTGEPLDLPYTQPQIEIFYEHSERFKTIPKGRRFGATNGAAHFCIEKLIEGKKILWVDTIQSNLDKYVNRYFIYGLKQIKKPLWSYSSQRKELKICDGILDLRSAEKPENIEGFGYDIIIMNEAGIILKGQKGRNLWYNSVYPMTLDYKADVYFLGTPKGKKPKKDEKPARCSLYSEFIDKGRGPNKHKDWITLQYSSYDNPLLDPADIKELEDDVPFVVRRQEIYGDCLDLGDESVFKTEWFKIVYELPPKHNWRRCILSMDTAFKKGAENDDSAATVILETTIGYFILYSWSDKLEFPELVKWTNDFKNDHRAIINFSGELPDLNYILIEDKASGQSLIQTFKSDVGMPIVPIKVNSDKFSRATAVSPLFETGKVFLLFGAWNKKFIDQMTDFNELMDSPDDIVDTVSQGLNYFKSSQPIATKPEVRRLVHTSRTLRGY